MFKRWISLSSQNALIIGPRRSGKTTFLKTNYPNYKYVTLDDFDHLRHAREDPKGFIESLGSKVIIDEIQRDPQLTIAVKKVIDEGKAEFLMTGSSSIGLLGASADSLAGRISIVNFPTTCWGEEEGEATHSFFTDEINISKLLDAKRKFDKTLKFGGFPEVVTAKGDKVKKELLSNYRDTYFTRDLAQISNIDNIEGLLAILQHIGKSIGSHLEVSNFAREAGLSHQTAKKYLNVLTQSQLAFRVYGHHFSPAKRYLKASKMYYADVSLINALGIEQAKGQIVESFVISEIEKRRKLKQINTEQLFYTKSIAGAEIDLVFEDEKYQYLIEVKSSKVALKKDVRNIVKYMNLNKGKKKFKSYLIYLGDKYQEIEGVKCIPAYALFRARL